MGTDEKKLNSKMTGHEIAKRIGRVEYDMNRLLDESGGEITEECERLMQEIEALSEKAEDKIVNTVQFLRKTEEDMEALRALHEKRMEAVSVVDTAIARLENTQSFLKGSVKRLMEADNIRGLRIDGQKVWIQEYESVNFDLSEEDEKRLIDAGFGEVRTTNYIDKRKLKSAVQDAEKAVEWLRSQGKIELNITEKLRGI